MVVTFHGLGLNQADFLFVITPHAQYERGEMIGVGVHIYICGEKKSYLSIRLTFSNICGMTFCRIYRLALPLGTPEILSSSSKSRIFLYNVHLALFVRRMTQLRSHKLISNYRHLGI